MHLRNFSLRIIHSSVNAKSKLFHIKKFSRETQCISEKGLYFYGPSLQQKQSWCFNRIILAICYLCYSTWCSTTSLELHFPVEHMEYDSFSLLHTTLVLHQKVQVTLQKALQDGICELLTAKEDIRFINMVYWWGP